MSSNVWYGQRFQPTKKIWAYHLGQWRQSQERWVWQVGSWRSFRDTSYLPPFVNGSAQGIGGSSWTVPANIGRARLLLNAVMNRNDNGEWADQEAPPNTTKGGGKIIVEFDVVPGERYEIMNDPIFMPAGIGQPTQSNVWVVLGLRGEPEAGYDPVTRAAAGGGDEGESGSGGGGTQSSGGAAGPWQGAPTETAPEPGGPLKGGRGGVDRDNDQGNISGVGATGGFGWFGGGGTGARGIWGPAGGGSSRIQIPANRNPLVIQNSRGNGDYKNQWGGNTSYGWQIVY